MKNKYLRSLNEVLLSRTVMSSGEGLCFDIEGSNRRRAIIEVLCRIPDKDYEKLEEAFEHDFEWLIPDYHTRGFVRLFYARIYPEDEKLAPYNILVYLSPTLERASWDIVVAVVAHELAHITLGHNLKIGPDEYDAQEEAVFRCLCEWGFEREAKKHREMTKRLEGET